MTTAILEKGEKVSVITGMASLFASLIAGMACIGPLLGIMLGISGLGWLSSYSYLTLPASMASLTLLAAALSIYKRRKTSCADRRKHRLNVYLLVVTTLMVIGINVFEYLVFPNLS